MKRAAVVLLAAILAAPVALAATLNLATVEDWENLDPAFANGIQTGAMVAKLFDGLMRYDFESSDVVPNLAREVVVNDDATVFTFHLHEGVQFHDGSILTASDVKFSFERVVSPETAGPLGWVFTNAGVTGAAEFAAGEADEISGIRVIDDLTVEISLDRPFAMFLYHLAMPAAHVVPAAVASELGAGFSNNPVGTGPFLLGDRMRDSHLNLVRFDDYFAGPAQIEGVHYRIITDSLIRWQEFLAGNIDSIGVPDAIFAEVMGDPELAALVHTNASLSTFYWAMNQHMEIFQDIRVRQALAMAIDRQAIIDGPYNGKDVLANGPIPPGLSGYQERDGIEYDPEAARALLAEAGYPNGFELELWSTRAEVTVAVTELIAFFLSEIGVTTTINQVDFGVLIDAAINGRAPAFVLSWGADYADAYNFLQPLFVDLGPIRFNYSNDEVTALLAEAATLGDIEDRIPLYQQAEDLVVADVPVMFFRHPIAYTAIRPEVSGLLVHPIFNADKFLLVVKED